MNKHCCFFKIMNIYHVKSVILINNILKKIIQKNCNYFSFFLHTLLCDIFVFFMFCFASLTVIAGKEIDVLESEKKNCDDKNVYIAIYNESKPCENNMKFSENGIIFYSLENDLLKLPEKYIVIPLSLVELIKRMPLEQELLFIKKISLFDADSLKQKDLCLFDFFYKLDHLYSFLMHDDKDIKFIMEHVYYVGIVEIFRFCGFPSVKVVENVKTWVDLEKGYTLDWLWKNLSLHFKEQGVPNKHVFFSLIAEMKKEIKLPNKMSNYLSEFEKCWFHGKKIPKHRNKDDWCMVKRKLNNFFSFLSSKNIMVTKIFFTQMKHFDFEKMISFCDKCKCFYENSQEKLSISWFFLKSSCAAEVLLKYNNEDIKFIATHPFYKNIITLYRACEFPPATIVRKVDTWINIREGITPEWIWNNLSLSFRGSGIPEKEVFFSRVIHIERDVNFTRYYQIIEYGLQTEKSDNSQKCSDAYNKKNIEMANELLVFLARKKIYNVFSFIDIVLELDVDKIADFCDKIIYFYSKSEETKSIIPIFLNSMEQVYLFLENSREDIEFIAQHSAYPFIVKVYFGVSFPIASCVREVDTWKYFFEEENISLISLWISLKEMFTGCGVPTKKEFFLRCFQLSHKSHNIHRKKQKNELTTQKIKSKDETLLLPSLDIGTLKGIQSKNKVGNDKKLNNLYNQKSKEKIGTLLTFLIKKRTENIGLAIELLFNLLLELDDNTMADFCNKIMYFYSNTEDKRSLFSSFLNSMKKVNLFLRNTNEEIEFIARHPCYSEIYEIYFGVCFPSASCVKKFDTWKNIVENITLVLLWKLLAKMFPGSGVPKKGTFLLHWFTLSHKQHKIFEKKHGSELTLQEKGPNFDNVLLSLLLNTDMLNDSKRKNKISNDQEEKLSEDWNEGWNKDWSKKIINKVSDLWVLLENKNVEDIPSFMNVMLKLNSNNIIIFCDKIIFFYSKADEKRSIVPIFLNTMKNMRLFLHKNTKKNIEFIAQHPYYSYISEVYRGVNFPDAFDVSKIELWKEVAQDTTSIFLWKLLAKAFVGYGVPSKEMFFFFCSCCDAFYEKNEIPKKK